MLSEDDADLVASFHGADAVLVVTARQVFSNCARYVHNPSTEISVYAPVPGHTPPTPAWKQRVGLREYLPRHDAG